MSEYWKSTPKYWCKFCKTYVRDTKLEKQQHEATPRHQGNIQRSLRNLHREHEREDREKQRAKDEVARLNGVVSGNPVPKLASSFRPPPPVIQQQPTADDRKRQMKQLAEMGVAIPQQFRGDMALAGDWETVSERPLNQDVKPEALSHGVRKRKVEDEEEDEDEDAPHQGRRKGWGSTFRNYPGQDQSGEDIAALLNPPPALKTETADENIVKKEEDKVDTEIKPEESAQILDTDQITKIEETSSPAAPVVFKKRKSKALKVS